MIHVLDKNDNIVATLSNETPKGKIYWNDKHHEKVKNAYGIYNFTTIDEQGETYLVNKNKVVIKDLDGNFIPFVIEKVEQDSHNGREKRIEAEAEHISDLRTSKIIEPITLQGATINTAADEFLMGTKWKRGITEFAGSRTVHIKEYMSCLKSLHQLASAFEVELRFRVEFKGSKVSGRYVDFLKPTVAFSGQELIMGRDLIGITCTEETANVFTALYGIGMGDQDGQFVTFESINNGVKWVGDEEARQRWSPDEGHLFGTFQYQSNSGGTPTPKEVKDATEKALKTHIDSLLPTKLLEMLWREWDMTIRNYVKV
ncbi:hypothetical protein E1I69_20515 [Bacillus timonensis]|uniref:Tail spike domain-containing protein n=1 Tax=Bacillus timonensis TaxID=1033734 RepID=A0A4V6RST3_9BACI|nr:phage tail spike protein [Bacillus timonensis]THE09953.1 hypothetical protein E1I69_20515 [Bacillus timonensis]